MLRGGYGRIVNVGWVGAILGRKTIHGYIAARPACTASPGRSPRSSAKPARP